MLKHATTKELKRKARKPTSDGSSRGIHILAPHGRFMRNAIAMVICLLASVTVVIPPAEALPANPVDNGMLFGGQMAHASNATVLNENLSELKAVVEVYTATWCESCVYVEHALDDVKANGLIQQYHIHSTLGDPFGTPELEQRWRDKYEPNSPPGVVFNGTVKKVGKTPTVDTHDNDHDNLVEEFSALAHQDLGLGFGSTSFSWTPTNANEGTLAWSLDLDAKHLENATLNVTAWVVEVATDYQDGTNGQGTYPHIVHNIQVLGHSMNGTAPVSLPVAHDDDDLQVHLLYEIVPDPPEDDAGDVVSEKEDSEDTPAVSMLAAGLTLILATAFSQRNRPGR